MCPKKSSRAPASSCGKFRHFLFVTKTVRSRSRKGRQGLIVNVFTEPAWRRRGLAKLLMNAIIAWSREQNLDGLVLHASDDGRALYEQLGFICTTEMRLGGGDD